MDWYLPLKMKGTFRFDKSLGKSMKQKVNGLLSIGLFQVQPGTLRSINSGCKSQECYSETKRWSWQNDHPEYFCSAEQNWLIILQLHLPLDSGFAGRLCTDSTFAAK